MLSKTANLAAHTQQDFANNNDPCNAPCKSALEHDEQHPLKTKDVPKTTPAAAAAVFDNEWDDEEGPFAGSKAEKDLAYAQQWLKANPEVLARVKETMARYDPKFYQQYSSTNVPFWRGVMSDLVGKATMASEDSEEALEGHDTDDGFFAVDLARVIVQMAKFRRCFPRVEPFYAVKCNDSEPMLAMISALGGGFDCASKGEFQKVLSNGFQTTEGIIFAHPCKMTNNIVAANRSGVYMTTFDNEEELEKLQKLMPKAKAVLRIATDDSEAVCELSSKFGCPIEDAAGCLERARQLGVEVIGVSFHVGSGNNNVKPFHKALNDARKLFDYGAELGHDMTLLDIGGGFPGSDPQPDENGKKSLSFEEIAEKVGPMIDELFPSDRVRVIAEPGRYFAESPFSIAMCIHSRRRVTKSNGAVVYQHYTSDGKYQSFNCMLYDHQRPNVHVLRPDPEAEMRTTTIFGPTCDGMDWIMQEHQFPALDRGDWIYCADFGAYTLAAGSKFNGFATRRVEFVSSIDVNAL